MVAHWTVFVRKGTTETSRVCTIVSCRAASPEHGFLVLIRVGTSSSSLEICAHIETLRLT